MTERFQPEGKTSPERERDEFIRQETEAFRTRMLEAMGASDRALPTDPDTRERQKQELRELPEEKMFDRLFNNLLGWLPPSEEAGGSVGMYRSEMYAEDLTERKKALIRDVDAFLKENDLEEFASTFAKQVAINQKAMMEAFAKRALAEFQEVKLLSDEDVLEFKKRLWHALRMKGYTKKELRT